MRGGNRSGRNSSCPWLGPILRAPIRVRCPYLVDALRPPPRLGRVRSRTVRLASGILASSRGLGRAWDWIGGAIATGRVAPRRLPPPPTGWDGAPPIASVGRIPQDPDRIPWPSASSVCVLDPIEESFAERGCGRDPQERNDPPPLSPPRLAPSLSPRTMPCRRRCRQAHPRKQHYARYSVGYAAGVRSEGMEPAELKRLKESNGAISTPFLSPPPRPPSKPQTRLHLSSPRCKSCRRSRSTRTLSLCAPRALLVRPYRRLFRRRLQCHAALRKARLAMPSSRAKAACGAAQADGSSEPHPLLQDSARELEGGALYDRAEPRAPCQWRHGTRAISAAYPAASRLYRPLRRPDGDALTE